MADETTLSRRKFIKGLLLSGSQGRHRLSMLRVRGQHQLRLVAAVRERQRLPTRLEVHVQLLRAHVCASLRPGDRAGHGQDGSRLVAQAGCSFAKGLREEALRIPAGSLR